MMQNHALPLKEVLGNSLIVSVFEKHHVKFGIADEDVYDPTVTLWAMISQFLFSGKGRSCKAAAGRVVSLVAQFSGKVVAQNAGNFCRAKAKTPVAAIEEMTLAIAQQAEGISNEFDPLDSPLDCDQAEQRMSKPVIVSIRSASHTGRILNMDGFTVDAPDTEANQAVYLLPTPPCQPNPLTSHFGT